MSQNRIVYATSTVSATAHRTAMTGIGRVANAANRIVECVPCGGKYPANEFDPHDCPTDWSTVEFFGA